jgi:HlyD family secretion protein
MKKIFLYILGGSLLFALALSLKSCSSDKLLKVTTEKAQYRNILETVSADGNIQPTTIVKISPDVPGQIIELPVVEGQRVKKNDLIAKIFPDTYRSAVDQAEAAYNSAKAALSNAQAQLVSSQAQDLNQKTVYERNKKLFDKGAIAQADMDASTAAFQSAEANLKSAQDNIDAAGFNAKSAEATMNEAHDNLVKTSVLSPIDGVIVGLLVKQGERVVGTDQFAGTEMMSVADLSNMEADVNVNENDIVNVKVGDTALIEVDAFINRKFKGVVINVSNSANVSANASSSVDQVTNFTVKIHILASSYTDLMPPGTNDSPFKPGMSATADIQVKEGKHILSVPIGAVTTRKGKGLMSDTGSGKSTTGAKGQVAAADSAHECVFIYNTGKCKMAKVTTGIQDADYIEIKTGIKEGDEIISGPFTAISQALFDGSTVKKVDKSELFAASGTGQ